MSLSSQVTVPSTNPTDVQQLASGHSQHQRRWWHPARLAVRFVIACIRGMLAVFFMLVGAVVALLVDHKAQFGPEIVRPSGIARDIIPGQSPGVQFLAETTPLFDVLPPDVRVRVCSYCMDLDVGAQIVMVDHRTFTVQQMSDALKVITALEPPSSRQPPCLGPPPIIPGDEVDSPAYVDVDRSPAWVDVDRDDKPNASRN